MKQKDSSCVRLKVEKGVRNDHVIAYGLAKADPLKKKCYTSTPKYGAKRIKRSQSVSGKGKESLHQEFLKIINAAKSAVETDNFENDHSCIEMMNLDCSKQGVRANSAHTAEDNNDEQLVPSPVPPLSSKDILHGVIDSESRECTVPSPQCMELYQQPFPSSDCLNTQLYLTQGTCSEQTSTILNGSLENSALDNADFMNDILQMSSDLLNTSMDSNKYSHNSNYTRQESDTYIDVCNTDQEPNELSGELFFTKMSSANNSPSNSKHQETKNDHVGSSIDTTISYPKDRYQTPLTIRILEEAMEKDKLDMNQGNPQGCVPEEKMLEDPSPILRVENATGEIEDAQTMHQGNNTADEKKKEVGSISLQPPPIPSCTSNKVPLAKPINKEIEPSSDNVQLLDPLDAKRDENNSEDFYGDLSLSYSQFLDIDAKCQQVKDESPEPSKVSPSETSLPQSKLHPLHVNFTVPTAPNMSWTQAVTHNRQRLQAITQEISRLNAMVLRARRTLWPQHKNTSESAPQGLNLSPIQCPSPHLHISPRAVGEDLQSYPDWNYA